MEYPLARAPQLRGEIAEQALLDLLERRALLGPADRLALYEWIGYQEEIRAHELWPSVTVRRVNHLKLTVAAEGAPTLKLYLCAESIPRADLR
jgi:hypothetical protein